MKLLEISFPIIVIRKELNCCVLYLPFKFLTGVPGHPVYRYSFCGKNYKSRIWYFPKQLSILKISPTFFWIFVNFSLSRYKISDTEISAAIENLALLFFWISTFWYFGFYIYFVDSIYLLSDCSRHGTRTIFSIGVWKKFPIFRRKSPMFYEHFRL